MHEDGTEEDPGKGRTEGKQDSQVSDRGDSEASQDKAHKAGSEQDWAGHESGLPEE